MKPLSGWPRKEPYDNTTCHGHRFVRLHRLQGLHLACKVENHVPKGNWRNWVKQDAPDPKDALERSRQSPAAFSARRLHALRRCHLRQACPTGATYKDKTDGTVKVNKDSASAAAAAFPACPYGARYRHPGQKRSWTNAIFAPARRERGETPACVVTCPTKARAFGDINDPKSDAAKLLKKHPTVRVIHAATDTKPNMYYIAHTAPMDWPRKATAPTPIAWLKSVYPLIWGMIGLNAIGVLFMLGKQIFFKDEEEKPVHGETPTETKGN